jgi:hypothetical protein
MLSNWIGDNENLADIHRMTGLLRLSFVQTGNLGKT